MSKETESQRQVRQMVNFIMQEANEKVNEIKIMVLNLNQYSVSQFYCEIYCIIYHSQTDHDFNLEKQQLIHNGKLKVQEEFNKKMKDLEIQERV